MVGGQFTNYLWMVGLALPLILASIGGLVWAVMNWKKASQPAMFAAIACGVLMLFSCIFPALHNWVPRMVLNPQGGVGAFERLMWVTRGIAVSQSLCWGLCVGALVFAVFAGRAAEARKSKDKDKKKRSRDEDEDDEPESERPRSRPRKEDDDDGIQDKPRSKRPTRKDDDDD